MDSPESATSECGSRLRTDNLQNWDTMAVYVVREEKAELDVVRGLLAAIMW